ncbi:MAG TPA: hypothetical protein VGX78_17505 [Pirellulales bacterium]|jgi:hypothetical protein|nr:hypothetical protein [Pirellulales bacterium]
MLQRRTVVDDWRLRLAEWRDRLEHSTRRPWLAKLYVRLYSYLIHRYGGETDDEEPVSVTPADDKSSMPFFVAQLVEGGKPPRTPKQIRAVLDAVHDSNPDRAAAGPLVAGLAPDDMIAIFTCVEKRHAAWFVKRLETAGVASEVRRRHREFQVFVRMADRQRAQPHLLDSAGWSVRRNLLWQQALASAFAPCGLLAGFAAGAWLISSSGPLGVSKSLDVQVAVVFSVAALGAFVGAAIGFIVGLILDG